MSSPPFDVVVIGVGAVGSATVAELAARGVRVLGLERDGIPNEHGSSGGVNRMIRLAYSEDPRYVPLLRAAFERWRRLEARGGERLLVTTGGVDAGSPDSQSVTGSLESCRVHDLPHELLDATQLRRRFPGFALPDGMLAVYQPDAGFVMSERAIAAYAMQAIEDGAELHGHEPVIDWEPRGDGVIVRTAEGEYRADRLVISAGAWAAGLAEPLRSLLVPERQVLIWMQPMRPERFRVGAFPVFVLEAPEGRFYGFPSYGIPGFKLGLYHHRGQQVDPEFDRPGDHRCPRRGGPAGGQPALLPGCGRPDADPQDVPLHQHARRALHHRPLPRAAAGRAGLALLGPWLQVRERAGRGAGRHGHGPDAGVRPVMAGAGALRRARR